MALYAATTRVPIDRSKVEIEQTLIRYGVDEFFYGRSSRGCGIAFKYKGRAFKHNVPNPDRGQFPDTQAGEVQYKQAERQRWRIFLLGLKAKLEWVDAGLSTFEDEFLAQTCLKGGKTVSESLQPQIEQMLLTGEIPKLLLPAGEQT